jgi:hypothetical protein
MDRFESRTALLAIAFGKSLLAACAMARSRGVFHKRTARETAVLSRVLEKRLVEMRSSIAGIVNKGDQS